MENKTVEIGKKVIKFWKISLIFLGFGGLFALSTVILAQFHYLYAKNIIITTFAFVSMTIMVLIQYFHMRAWKNFLRKNIHLFSFNPDYVLNIVFSVIFMFLCLIPVITMLLAQIGFFNPLWLVSVSGVGVVSCCTFAFLKICEICKKLNNSIK